jgi:uncharacterized LabA/DUF88 family protein
LNKNPQNNIQKSNKAIAFIDYANIKAWLRGKKLGIDMNLLYEAMSSVGISNIYFYYGSDPDNIGIQSFFKKLQQFGYIIITKPIQYFKISLSSLLQQKTNIQLLENISVSFKDSLEKEAFRLDKSGITLLTPKANFDVEITVDILEAIVKTEHIILFSGDGDFVYLLKKLKMLGKKVTVVSGRKSFSGELMQEAYRFVTMELLAETITGLTFKNVKNVSNAKITPHEVKRLLKNCTSSISNLLGLSSEKLKKCG